MLNWSLIKYKNTIIKHYIFAQEQNIYSCIYKMLINAGTMLYKGRISYLLVLNQRWAVRGSRAFSAGPLKNKIVWKSFFIDYLGIIFICVMSTKLPMISLVEVELE